MPQSVSAYIRLSDSATFKAPFNANLRFSDTVNVKLPARVYLSCSLKLTDSPSFKLPSSLMYSETFRLRDLPSAQFSLSVSFSGTLKLSDKPTFSPPQAINFSPLLKLGDTVNLRIPSSAPSPAPSKVDYSMVIKASAVILLLALIVGLSKTKYGTAE